MKKGKVEKTSRVELLIRIPYFIAFYILAYIVMIVIGIWGVWMGIMYVLNWWYILVTGKRASFMQQQIQNWYDFAYKKFYISWVFQKCLPYFILLTDERPGFNI